MFKKYLKRHLTIKTKYNPKIQDDVIAFEKACSILEKQGIDFETSSEIVATELGKKIYFRYSLITDILIWIILPLISLIIIF